MHPQGILTFALSEFPEGVSQRTEQLRAADLDVGEAGIVGAVAADIEISRLREELRIRGDLRFHAERACARCLETAATDFVAQLEVLVRGRNARETEEAPEGVIFHEGEGFSLLEEVRQALLLELPVVALCSPDCQGLCPHCGGNRNRGECQCKEQGSGDPRWHALKDWSEDDAT